MKIYLILLFISLSSCTAFYHGTLSESSSTEEDYSIVNFARGYAKISRFWGIGGFNRDALIADAKKNLLKTHPLKKGQRFANFILDIKNAFYFPGIHTTTVVVTAEIITKSTSNFLEEQKDENKINDNHFSLGQNVYYYYPKEYRYIRVKILDIYKKMLFIGFEDSRGRYRIKKVMATKVRSNPKMNAKTLSQTKKLSIQKGQAVYFYDTYTKKYIEAEVLEDYDQKVKIEYTDYKGTKRVRKIKKEKLRNTPK